MPVAALCPSDASMPSGWLDFLGGITWGTDAYINTSAGGGASPHSGTYVFEIPSGTSEIRLYQHPILAKSDELFLVEAVVMSSSSGASSKVRLDASYHGGIRGDGYPSDEGVTFSLFNSNLSAANTWKHISGYVMMHASGRYIMASVGRSSSVGGAHSVWVDRLVVQPAPYHFQAVRATSSQAVATATTTQLVYNSSTYTRGFTYSTSTGALTCKRPRLHEFSASAFINSTVSDAKKVSLLISKNGTEIVRRNLFLSVADTPIIDVHTGPVLCDPGDEITVSLRHNQGSDVNVDPDSTYSWFRGCELHVI